VFRENARRATSTTADVVVWRDRAIARDALDAGRDDDDDDDEL